MKSFDYNITRFQKIWKIMNKKGIKKANLTRYIITKLDRRDIWTHDFK